MDKRIGLTYDLKTDYVIQPDDPHDIAAELDNERTINELSQAIIDNGYEPVRIGNVRNVLKSVPNLNVDLILNIAEGYKGRNRESQVPLILELYNVPFIGADALTLGLTLDKVLTKKVLIAEGIPTPRFIEIRNLNDAINMDHLKFPLIVKPRYEGSSKGLSDSSRVSDMEALKRQAELIIDKYKQPALVEEFIKGKEFTVPIVGNDPPEVFPAVQISIDGQLDLQNAFYTFARLTSDKLKYVCPAQISKSLEEKLREAALKTYLAVDCRDLGRVDFRVDDKENLFVLEINPLPILSHEDAFMIVAQQTKIGYNGIIKKIIDSAVKRLRL
jgi:D-alanine-D-alanine ligase